MASSIAPAPPVGGAPGSPGALDAGLGASPKLRAGLLALGFGGFTIGTTEFVPMGLLPQVAHGVHVSIPTGGHLISAYAIGVVVGAPTIAGLGAKLPRRRMLVMLMLAYAFGNFLSALAPNYNLLLASRFLAGLPHGAFFGVAALVAADLAGPTGRAKAVSKVLLGLSVANVLGVPVATWLGQWLGWRAAFVVVSGLALLTVVGLLRLLPWTPANTDATFRRELTALRRPQVWFAVGTAAIGGAGMFAIYAYISPILTQRSGVALAVVPIALAIWGLGMVAGTIVGGWLTDRHPVRSVFAMMAAMAVVYALYTVASLHPYSAVIGVFFMGGALAMPTALQMRLMHASGDAQTLGAALNHSAFNIANALGAAVGGAVIAAGWGLAAPMWAAVGLSLGGVLIFAIAIAVERRSAPAPA